MHFLSSLFRAFVALWRRRVCSASERLVDSDQDIHTDWRLRSPAASGSGHHNVVGTFWPAGITPCTPAAVDRRKAAVRRCADVAPRPGCTRPVVRALMVLIEKMTAIARNREVTFNRP